MKKLILLLTLLAAIPVFAAQQTWTNVSVMDGMCLAKLKATPDKHTVKCLLQCAAEGGLGIITEDGAYLKLDDAGKQKLTALLKATDKADHIRVNVTGEQDGDTIKVADISLQ